MRDVLLVSDSTEGGAGIACRRLFEGFRCGRADVSWLAVSGDKSAGATIVDEWPSLASIIKYRLAAVVDPSDRAGRQAREAFIASNLLRQNAFADSPVVNLHSLHEAVSFDFVERLPSSINIVWTLHDMWPITGYCYYSYDCQKYLHGCRGECPQKGRCGAMVQPAWREWERRERFFMRNRDRIIFIAPSRWMASCAMSRFNGVIRVEQVRNGLNLQVFYPLHEKRCAKEVLGFPGDQLLVLTVLSSLGEPRKGLRQFIDSIAMLRKMVKGAFVVVAIGSGSIAGMGGEGVCFAGNVRDEKLMNLYYNAADVFVSASLADNLPNTLVEARAAGTPSVAFDTGGCSELIEAGKTGFLARPGDSGSLAECAARVLNADSVSREQFRRECRCAAEADGTNQDQASRYLQLFRNSI